MWESKLGKRSISREEEGIVGVSGAFGGGGRGGGQGGGSRGVAWRRRGRGSTVK